MTNLSPASLTFLRQIKRNPMASLKQEAFEQSYTQLFCELYDIMRDVKASLDQQNVGSWILTYKGSELDRSLSFSFNLHMDFDNHSINVDLTINPFATSAISILSDIPAENISAEAMKQFRNSPAYRRYFAPFTTSSNHLVTEISQRQINSRHFGGYLIHICEMALPYIKSLQEGAYQRQLAVA